MSKQKLQLIHIPWKNCSCISQPHYDLCTLEKYPKNIGCILIDKDGAKLIRKWIKQHNKEIKNGS